MPSTLLTAEGSSASKGQQNETTRAPEGSCWRNNGSNRPLPFVLKYKVTTEAFVKSTVNASLHSTVIRWFRPSLVTALSASAYKAGSSSAPYPCAPYFFAAATVKKNTMSSQTLTFKGRRVSMYDLYTQSLPDSPSLKIRVYIYMGLKCC